jgi:predicted lipid-binding transport protein (Tim44 family)
MIEILIFAILSVYLFFRLWNILGTRNGSEKTFSFYEMAKKEKVIEIDQNDVQNVEKSVSPLDYEEERIRKLSPNFSFDIFVKGAKIAFKKIIESYNQGNLSLLKKLTKENVFEKFDKALEQRKNKDINFELEILDLNAQVYSVKLEGSDAYITVRFVSKQIKKQKKDYISADEDNNKDVEEVTDIWCFTKNLKDSNPTWFLSSTEVKG